MKKLISISILSAAFLFGSAMSATAQTPTTTPDITSLQAQIQQLLQENAQLKTQIAELQKSNTGLQSQILQITTRLHKGMRGDDVKHLQEILATDKDIFSKANETGFFGDMTEKAVEHFQKHFGLDPIGEVGPKTMHKLNELLKEHDASEQDLSENDLGDLGDQNDGLENENEQGDHNGTTTATSSRESGGEKHGGD